MIRILVADPDLSVRLALQGVFARQKEFAVVGEARNGQELLALVSRQPDVVLLSARCLEHDGEPLMTLSTLHLLPVVVMADAEDGDRAGLTRAAGARQVVPRPRKGDKGAALAPAEADSLLEILRLHARDQSPDGEVHASGRHILAIGASTGGPVAVMRLLNMIPPGLDLSVLIVQHMASGLMAGYAAWLDRDSPLSVRMARGGERLVPGVALVAPGGYHLSLHQGRLRVTTAPPVNSCRPSVDVLFSSLAQECPEAVVAVLMTGIGRDGARGMAELKAGGAHTIAQDEETCVVFGMPRAAIELGAAAEVLPLDAIAPAILRQFDIGI